MKKLITCLAMLSMVLASIPAAAFETAAAVSVVTTAASESKQIASPADLAGKWFFQPKDDKTAGIVTVSEDGTFRCVQDQNTIDGNVIVHFDTHSDGTETVIYKFFISENNLWTEGMLSADGKTLDLSQDGSTGKMVRDETVRKASAAEIAGTWLLKEQEKDGKSYSTSGTVSVNTDNTYTYVDNAGNKSTGSAYALYELHPDNTVTIWYFLYDSNGKQWIGCQEDKDNKTPKTLSVGHAAGQILERVSNSYESGFKDVVNPPATSVSVAALSGLWKNSAKPTEVLKVYTTNEKDLYNANFTLYDSKGIATAGVVKLQYTLNQDGKEEYWYVFYTREDQGNGKTELKFWNGFAVSGVLPLEDLYAGQSGEPHFHRNTGEQKPNADGFYEITVLPVTSISTKNIEGSWKCDKETVEFYDCSLLQGSFKKTNADGTTAEGTVKMEYSLDKNDKQQDWWNLYTKDGKFLMSFKVDGSIQLADLYAGADGKQHYVRAAADPKPNADGFYEIKELPATSISTKNIEGSWTCDKETVEFYDCSQLQGSFKKTNADGTSTTGTVKMEYSLDKDGKRQDWWNLYTKDGKFLMSFKLDGSVQLADLYAGADGKQHYVRAAETVIGDLTGDGVISAEDAQLALTAYTQRIAGNASGLNEAQSKAADVDGNGEISVEDAQFILLYYTEKTVAGKEITWNDLLKKKHDESRTTI